MKQVLVDINKLSSHKQELFARALRARKLKSSPSDRIPKRTGSGPIELSYAQERMWVLDRLEPGNPAYNVLGSVEIEGDLDVSILEKVLKEIVRRHEILRTTFEFTEGRPVQTIHTEPPTNVVLVDLS